MFKMLAWNTICNVLHLMNHEEPQVDPIITSAEQSLDAI